MLWPSGLSHHLSNQHPILKHQFKSQLLYFQSTFLVMHLGRQQIVLELLGNKEQWILELLVFFETSWSVKGRCSSGPRAGWENHGGFQIYS